MAALEKLAIRGIRSFDDKRLEVIQFFTPVTVIVGQNGSGKTTIIECLKYATTGDQPPNTRGGAFVHDPKMAAEKEVKAQVKLRFKAANGKPMMVVRSLSVTLKKTSGMTMKTLEAMLSALPQDGENDGKRRTISTKCAEMDAEIPNLLGVSKAVLDNVIFCHQEDSYWPLAEASVLKKKFDEIFEASKYTKALDAIKNLRKERVNELKVDRERLEGASREKHHADKLKRRIADLNATVAAKVLEYEEWRTQAEALAIQNKEFYERATKFRDTFRQYETAEARLQQLQQDRKEISENLDILEGADEELEERRRTFEHYINSQRLTRNRKERDLQDEEERVADVRRQLGDEQKREGQLLGEERAYHKNLEKRTVLVRDISRKVGLKGFEHDVDQNQYTDFRSRMGEFQRRHINDLEAIQAEGQHKVQEFNARLQKLHAETARLEAERQSLREKIRERQEAINSAETRVDLLQTKVSELKGIASEVQSKKERVAKLRDDIFSSQYQRQIEDRAAAIRRLDQERERLANELASNTQQMESRASLALRSEEALRLSTEIQDLLDGMTDRYQQFLGRKPEVETLERDLDRAVVEKEKEIKDLEAKAGAANRELAAVESTMSNHKSRQKQMEIEVKALDKRLTILRGEHATLSLALADTQEQASLCQNEISKLVDSAKFYQDVLKNGRSHKICTSCNRHLQESEMDAFEKHVSSLLQRDSTATIQNLQEELSAWQEEASKLQSELPLEVKYNTLKEMEIPRTIAEQAKLEGKLEDATSEAHTITDQLERARLALKSLQSLKQQANVIAAAGQRRNLALGLVETLEASLRDGASIKSLDEIQSELSLIQEKQHVIEREKQAISSDRDLQNDALHSLESELHSLLLGENQLQNDVKEGERLKTQAAEGHGFIKTARARIKEIEANLLQANEPVKAVEAEQRTYNTQHRLQVAAAQRDLQEIMFSIDKLDNSSLAIEEYIKDQGDRKLKRCQEKLVDMQESIQRSLEDIARMRSEMDTLGQEVSSANTTLSTLKDNIRLRKLNRDIHTVEVEMGRLDLEEASRARQQFDEKYGPAKAAEEEATRQSQHLQGELASLRAQLKDLERDAREYKDATKKYTEQLIKTKMADMVNNDLEKYAKALDSAIMKYHSIKMAEVNDTMRHLWNRTYQGTDIDGIKIISEGDGTSGRRNYNYRVVMVKDQVEMDMRGRCSAGQKMLASIIIRLALSDSFGANCGILALDEPTNALDVENIEALAQSLVDIIRERRAQANFQLIIITHDENFLRKLGEASVIDYYWRVSRDLRQKSIVEKQAISL